MQQEFKDLIHILKNLQVTIFGAGLGITVCLLGIVGILSQIRDKMK